MRDRGEAYLYAQGQYLKVIEQINELLNRFHAAVANCPDPDDPNPSPAPGASGGGVSDNVAPNDPNDIQGPAGVGAERWIPRAQDLGYTIRFENLGPGSEHIPPGQSPATAPAVLVTIEHVLDDDVDLDAVELGDVGWGDRLVSVPGGLQSYHEDIPQADGDIVRVDGALDQATRTITWTMATIDPETGELETSASAGFLPPEDGSGNGQGFAAYGARGKDGLAHDTQLKAKASIRFDLNPVIETPEHTNTIDAAVPVSAVSAATQPGAGTAGCQEQLAVQWGGSDSGSGIAVHDLWVSTDGLPFTPWLAGSTATSATYPAQSGHTYAFASVVRDKVGNAETLPAAGDVTRTVAECDRSAPVTRGEHRRARHEGWLVSGAGRRRPRGRRQPGRVRRHAARVVGDRGDDRRRHGQRRRGGGGRQPGRHDRAVLPRQGRGEQHLGTAQAHAADRHEGAVDRRRLTRRGGAVRRRAVGRAAVHLRRRRVRGRIVHRLGDRHEHRGRADVHRRLGRQGRAPCGGRPPLHGLRTAGPARQHADPARQRSGGSGTPPPRAFRRRPVAITLKRVTSSSVRLLLRNSERFAVTGRAALRRRTGRAVPFSAAKAFRLKARGRATVVLRLNRAARRALRGGRTVPATVRLTLRSGAATKTVTKTLKLKLRAG